MPCRGALGQLGEGDCLPDWTDRAAQSPRNTVLEHGQSLLEAPGGAGECRPGVACRMGLVFGVITARPGLAFPILMAFLMGAGGGARAEHPQVGHPPST